MEISAYEDDIFYDGLGMRVWERRHQFVDNVLRKYQCAKILDMGCSEGKFLQRLSRDTNLTFLAGLDITEETLSTAQTVLQPEAIQSILQKQRSQRLIMNLYKGDATKKSQLLKNIEFDAITVIEMIEHIEKSQLTDFSENVFGFMKVNLVIVTTPNADFNIYFKQKNPLFTFRHPDHRYEMSRQEFEDWAQEVALRYDYNVTFDGVTLHKSGDQEYGHCSQVAIFVKKENFINLEQFPDEEPTTVYDLIQYPFDDRTIEEKVRDCFKYANYSSECIEEVDYWMCDLPYNQIAISFTDIFKRYDDIREIIGDIASLEIIIKKISNDKILIVERNNQKYVILTLEDEDDDVMEIEDSGQF